MRSSTYDTRFLIELFYSANVHGQRKIREALAGSRPNLVSVIALSELYEITLRRAGRAVAEMQKNALERDFRLVEVDEEIGVEAALIRSRRKMPLADSLIAATAKLLKVPCFTDDPHFRAVEGLKVKWIA